jgi:hypothetical protein
MSSLISSVLSFADGVGAAWVAARVRAAKRVFKMSVCILASNADVIARFGVLKMECDDDFVHTDFRSPSKHCDLEMRSSIMKPIAQRFGII